MGIGVTSHQSFIEITRQGYCATRICFYYKLNMNAIVSNAREEVLRI